MSQCGTRRQALCRARRAPPAFAARRGLQAPHVVRRAGRRAPSGRARGARRSARLCGAAVGDAEHLLGQRQPPAALAHARARVPAPLPPAARGRALCRALHGLLPAQQAHALTPCTATGAGSAAGGTLLACVPATPTPHAWASGDDPARQQQQGATPPGRGRAARTACLRRLQRAVRQGRRAPVSRRAALALVPLARQPPLALALALVPALPRGLLVRRSANPVPPTAAAPRTARRPAPCTLSLARQQRCAVQHSVPAGGRTGRAGGRAPHLSRSRRRSRSREPACPPSASRPSRSLPRLRSSSCAVSSAALGRRSNPGGASACGTR